MSADLPLLYAKDGAVATFTLNRPAARNALAKTLKGNTDGVALVKSLSKPATVPWAVNLLYWHGFVSYENYANWTQYNCNDAVNAGEVCISSSNSYLFLSG